MLISKLSLCLLRAPAPLAGQSASGKITGVVTDSAGLPVPNVDIEVMSLDTGQTLRAATNDSGIFVVSPLPVGDWRLQARKEGFKALSRSLLRIDINSALTLDLQLEIGGVSESVTVHAQACVIETENQSISNSRCEVQLKNLPIIVREIQTLLSQTAGVPYGTTDTVGGNLQQGGRSAMQILAGDSQLTPRQTTAWSAIDGMGRRADLTSPSIDSIAEVKWTANGGLCEFYRSSGMGARRWEAANRESFVRHQFGGPVKKDKLFFHGGADVFRHTSNLVLNAFLKV